VIITLLRKPLDGNVAENTLKHGCGSINIDATRVGTETMVSTAMSSLGVMHDDNWKSKPIEAKESNGRWPANFILTHKDDCESQGEDWACVEGCPVKELDELSLANGMHSAGSSRSAIRSSGKKGMFPMDGDGHRFGDDGGASRFFKQFKKDNDQ